jgi:ribonucleases P/MRP protein subunit RPP40
MRVRVNGAFSCWTDILSGVPQGSVLRPLLFILFVNDLPDWMVNSMRMFADDTKIWCPIRCLSDSHSLQDDLDKLSVWSDQWLLRFNADKCEVMHVGHKFPTVYHVRDGLNNQELAVVEVEKDLGVCATSNLKSDRQCAVASAKAMSVLGLIRRHFKKTRTSTSVTSGCCIRPIFAPIWSIVSNRGVHILSRTLNA